MYCGAKAKCFNFKTGSKHIYQELWIVEYEDKSIICDPVLVAPIRIVFKNHIYRDFHLQRNSLQ
jgi:hypothetical protein